MRVLRPELPLEKAPSSQGPCLEYHSDIALFFWKPAVGYALGFELVRSMRSRKWFVHYYMYLAPRSTFTSFAQRYPHVKPPRNPHPIYFVQKDAPNQCIQISQTTLPLTRIEIERDRKNVASFSSILKETPTPQGTHKETLCSDKPNIENKAKQKK